MGGFDFNLLREHATLTTQASREMIAAGAKRIQEERRFYAAEGWGEPGDEQLAAACYKAMVHWAIKRGLELDETPEP